MTADISQTDHNALVNDDSVRVGTIKLSRGKGGDTRMLVAFTQPAAQMVSLDQKEVRIFNPRTNVMDIYALGNRQSLVNQFLLLGFGAGSAELKATYQVSYVGEEKIDGQPTSHLKLVPKSPDTLRSLKQADLWFADNGVVAQQKFVQPSGDYKLVTYKNLREHDSIPDRELELKPKGALVQRPK